MNGPQRMSEKKLNNVRGWLNFIQDPMATANRETVEVLVNHIDALESENASLRAAVEKGVLLAERLDAIKGAVMHHGGDLSGHILQIRGDPVWAALDDFRAARAAVGEEG